MSFESISKTLIILPCITGSISFLSSTLLIVRLVRNRSTLLKKVKERLILGLSVMDIVFSTACIMSTFAGPTYLLEGPTREMYAHFHLMGSRATCNLQGWFYHFGVGAPLYNAALCFYYYLVICHRMQNDKIQKWIEPLMHIIIWAWSIANASIAVGLNLVWFTGYFGCAATNPNDGGRCTMNPNLPDCQVASYNTNVLILFLTMPPTTTSFLCIVVFLVLIYCKVRKTEARGKKWNFNAIMARVKKGAEIEESAETTKTTNVECSSQLLPTTTYDKEMGMAQKILSETDQDQENPSRLTSTTLIIARNNEDTGKSSNEMSPVNGQRQGGGGGRSKQQQERGNDNKLSNAISETGIQYVLAFVITFLPITIQLFLPKQSASLGIATFLTLPLQGFWNWVIYTRGRLKVLRNHHRHDGRRRMTCWNVQWWYTIFLE